MSFKNFPTEKKCPLCGTNEDKECVLAAIVGTQDGFNWEGEPLHSECVVKNLYIDKEINIVYTRYTPSPAKKKTDFNVSNDPNPAG